MDRFPPTFLSFLRFMIVGLAVLPWLRVRRGEMRWLLVAAICGGGLQFALIVIAAFIGSIGLVAIKRVHDLKPLELQAWLSWASLFAHTAYFALVHRYSVTSVAPITVLGPVFSVAFAILLLGDVLDWRMIVGGVMTLTGVAVIIAREGKIAGTTT